MHCIVHYEVLIARYATRAKVRSISQQILWVSGPNRYNELKRLLKDVFKGDVVAVLQIHLENWLSQGNIMTYLL